MIHTWKIPCRHVGRGWGPIKLEFSIDKVKELEELATSTDSKSDYDDPICPDDTLNFIPALLADLICFEKIDEFRHRSTGREAFLRWVEQSWDALEELNSFVVKYAHFVHHSLAVFEDELTSATSEHLARENLRDLPWAKAFSEVVSYTEKLRSAKGNNKERILAKLPEESLRELNSKLRSAFGQLIHLYGQEDRDGAKGYEGDLYKPIYLELKRNSTYAYLSSLCLGLEASEKQSGCLLVERQKVVWLASALEEDITPDKLVENAFSYASKNYCDELYEVTTDEPLPKALSEIRTALSEADESIRGYFSNRFPNVPGGNPKKGCAALIVPYSTQQKRIIAFNGVADDDQSLTVNGVSICKYFNKASGKTMDNLGMLLKSNAFNRKYDVARIHTDNLCVFYGPQPHSCVSLGEVMHGVKSVPNGSSKVLNRMFSCAERKAIAFANRKWQQCDMFEGYLYATREVCFICDWTIDYYNLPYLPKAHGGSISFNLQIDRKQPAYPTSPNSKMLQAFHDLSNKLSAGQTGLKLHYPCP